MCLCLFAVNESDEYPFVLLANRDEFRNRPAKPAHFWEDEPTLLAGKDLQGNGTWCGVSKNGKIAFLTNYRHPDYFNRKGPTRGTLVSNYLISNLPPTTYLESIITPEAYNGFNLVVGTQSELFYFSNVQGKIEKIENGLHGLSNAFLNTPWPKVKDGKQQLADAISKRRLNNNRLFSILHDENPFKNEKLPNTGVSEELEEMLAPKFINTKAYGTVCSTVIKIDSSGKIDFEERTIDHQGIEAKNVRFTID